MSTPKDEVLYICKKYPQFSFRLTKSRIQFQKGELRLTDPAEIKMLDGLLETNPTFKQLIKKVDKEAAEKFVRERMRQQQSAAVKGGVTAEDIKHAQTPLEERDANFANMTDEQSQTLTDEMQKDSDLVLTEKTNNPVVDSTSKPTLPLPSLASLVEKK